MCAREEKVLKKRGKKLQFERARKLKFGMPVIYEM